MNPPRSECIKKFLIQNTHQDLANLYYKGMECQVIVKEADGHRKENGFKGRSSVSYTNGIATWYPIRIPKNADTNPIDNDEEMNYDLNKYVLGIGMTGWDWLKKESIFVAFDYDSIVGHSERHVNKLTDTELKELEQAVSSIPWVTIRYSTSGRGRHLYIFLSNIKTNNHTEHAALGRSILGKMSGLVNYDFFSKVDAYGQNMWAWHEKMQGTCGLQIIKKGSILYDIPENWRDHLDVISGRRRKSIPFFIVPDEQDKFIELIGQKSRIPFDETHKELINYLNEHNFCCNYDSDHHIIICHTAALKQAFIDLKLKGVFETIAEGRESGDHNSWCAPLSKGAWVVRRYTRGIQEASTWIQDANGWTTTHLNKTPNLKIAARICGGIEHPTSGYVFTTAEDAKKCALMLGVDLNIPEWANKKKTKLKESSKDKRLIAEMDFDSNEDITKGGIKGFLQEGKFWKKIFDTPSSETNEIDASNFDDIVRHSISLINKDIGWSVKTRNGWQDEPLTHIKAVLKNMGYSKEIEQIVGNCVMQAWKIVTIPFKDEYPGNRQWNRHSAQLKYIPSQNKDNLNYETWDKLFNHLGKGLNDALLNNHWAKDNGITKGAEYLKLWVASLLQKPEKKLPYLFFYGDENTGKSTFQEALSLLIINGVQKADRALTSQGSFNGELESSILGIIEDTDLRKNKNAINLIKDWLTSSKITIHFKNLTPYDSPNYLHLVQTANDPLFCPVLAGDSRITMIYVNELKDRIPTEEFFNLLDKEAPDFICEMLNIEIPFSNDRTAIPIIITDEKIQAQSSNKNELELFIEECCFEIDGHMIKFSDFYAKFIDWLPPEESHNWSKIKTGRAIPHRFPYARNIQDVNNFYIGNISFTKPENGYRKPKIIKKDGKLITIAGKS